MSDLEPPPFTREYDLGRLGTAGAEVKLAAKGEQLARIAAWAEIGAVDSFDATVRLRKTATNRFVLDADLKADIVQNCVVTLDPVKSHIGRMVHRELHLADRIRLKSGEAIPLGAGAGAGVGDDDVPEEIENLTYDLAAPLLEEFLLAIDPYPRAPGVEFAAPEPEAPEPPRANPFAVLKSLKTKD